ncbi:PRELI domain containing protein 3B [Porphyridium purpureum]|uniref:PRELI domain containing protein 3B n=1 Tax=Porphyridium purpureum TaxID=35688 RepID=A0A5J4ZAJ5_PORPP|nr:PRELI domain containing protein 3B [Porphyridium purpureum]|eukprot:POR8473..scf295_1
MGLTEVQRYVYEHPWELVTAAHWMKYPNARCPQVLSADVLERRVEDGGRVLHTRRLFTGASAVPQKLHWLIPASPAYALEHSVVDTRERRMTLTLQSLSFANILQITETCVYEPHESRTDCTVFTQEWTCEWKVPSYLKKRLDSLSLQRFRASVENGRTAVAEICAELESRWDEAARGMRQLCIPDDATDVRGRFIRHRQYRPDELDAHSRAHNH